MDARGMEPSERETLQILQGVGRSTTESTGEEERSHYKIE